MNPKLRCKQMISSKKWAKIEYTNQSKDFIPVSKLIWKKKRKHQRYKASFTLMGDNEEVLIMDLVTLHFTLQ